MFVDRSEAANASRLNVIALQRRGLRLLDSAQAEAAALDPSMRALVLSEAAKGYERIDPVRADRLRIEAFAATLAIEQGRAFTLGECFVSEPCQIRQRLQREILQGMVFRCPARVEELFPSAETDARRSIVEALITEYANKKSFAQAEELLARATVNESFSYRAASQLMIALPKERAGDKLTIFMQAIENFRQYDGSSIPGSEDLGTLVLSFWQELPAPAVLDAIDTLLEQAKAGDENSHKLQITVRFKKGSAALTSAYEYRFFQLLPVLEQLDSFRAGDLLREDQESRATRQFPGGYESLVLGAHDDNVSLEYQFGGMSPIMSTFQLQMQAMDQLKRTSERIEDEARNDPRQAIVEAAVLPLVPSLFSDDQSPRAETLLTIARLAAAVDSSTSRIALEELHKILPELSLIQQGRLIINLGEMYLQLGDYWSARETVEEGLKIAEKLYARDTDLADPNQVIKVKWPSANVWWHLVSLAVRISPALAPQIVAEIPDPEIATFGKVELGKTLLGAATGIPLSAQERHRDGIDREASF